jgi:hypothetical protein
MGAKNEISGPIDFRHTYVDFSNVKIDPKYMPDNLEGKTCPPASKYKNKNSGILLSIRYNRRPNRDGRITRYCNRISNILQGTNDDIDGDQKQNFIEKFKNLEIPLYLELAKNLLNALNKPSDEMVQCHKPKNILLNAAQNVPYPVF